MKLFDRSVNLAQFPPGSSLYPVCRAWMANDPNNTETSTAAPKYVRDAAGLMDCGRCGVLWDVRVIAFIWL